MGSIFPYYKLKKLAPVSDRTNNTESKKKYNTIFICDHRRYRNAGWRHRVRFTSMRSVRDALLTMFPRSDHHEIAHVYAQEIE